MPAFMNSKQDETREKKTRKDLEPNSNKLHVLEIGLKVGLCNLQVLSDFYSRVEIRERIA